MRSPPNSARMPRIHWLIATRFHAAVPVSQEFFASPGVAASFPAIICAYTYGRGPGPRRSAFRAVQPGNDGWIRGTRGGTGAARRACNLQAMSILGTRVLRTEDPGFLTGGAVYTDDVALPGACEVFFARSPLAHARIRAIDVTGALAAPGVLAAFTGADLADLPLLPAPIPGLINDQMGQPPLARDVVRFV